MDNRNNFLLEQGVRLRDGKLHPDTPTPTDWDGRCRVYWRGTLLATFDSPDEAEAAAKELIVTRFILPVRD